MKSYWIDSEKEKKSYKALNKDIETDVCIIGGGITGVSVAYYLKKKIKYVKGQVDIVQLKLPVSTGYFINT